MSPPVRKQILSYLTGPALSHSDDSSRIVGSGCLGALCRWLSDDELSTILDEQLTQVP